MLVYLQAVPEHAERLPGYAGHESDVRTGDRVEVCAGVARVSQDDQGEITVEPHDGDPATIPYGAVERVVGANAPLAVTLLDPDPPEAGYVGYGTAVEGGVHNRHAVRFEDVGGCTRLEGNHKLTFSNGNSLTISAERIASAVEPRDHSQP